jgi:hypothetical protein
MWSDFEESQIRKYTKELLKSYYEDSRLESLTTVRKNEYLTDALTLGKRIILPQFEENVIMIQTPLIQGLQLGEFQYIIDALNKSSVNVQEYKDLPNREIIDEVHSKLLHSRPDFMIIPISFFVDVHNWGMRLDGSTGLSVMTYRGRSAYYDVGGDRMRILWSNKFVRLNEIIIGSKSDSLWQYRPDESTGERVTIRFEREKATSEPTLLLKTVFKYTPPPPENVSIIRFPPELTEIKE